MMQRRNTKQRKLVLDTVQTRMDHPSADDIYLDVRKEDSNISRGTVYRNLNLLAQSGEIRHIKIPGADRFDLRLEPHYHLLCTGCGKMMDVPIPYHIELDHSLQEETGYEMIQHRTVFEGICPQCKAQRSAEK